MAKKRKFPLALSDGTQAASIEELREHFAFAADAEQLVGYWRDSRLETWLNDRYYEDEAEAVADLDEDAPDLAEQICAALGLAVGTAEEIIDPEDAARLAEKKETLKQLGADAATIANAAKTALNQEDLADLLDADEPLIYLCGESFTIPARLGNRKYIGVLGAPRINIKAKTAAELREKNIVLENVVLPDNLAELSADTPPRPVQVTVEVKREKPKNPRDRLRYAAHEEWEIGEANRAEKRLLNAALDEWGDFPFGDMETAWN